MPDAEQIKVCVEIIHVPSDKMWVSWMTHEELQEVVDQMSEVNIDQPRNSVLCTNTRMALIVNNGPNDTERFIRKVYLPHKILSECSVEFKPIPD
jgi:hypothetical protein